MRKLVMSGVAAVAVVLGCSGIAVAASGADVFGAGTTAVSRTAAGGPAAPAELGQPADALLGNASKISCGAVTSCLAVGEDSSGRPGNRAGAEVLRGGTWRPVTVRAPGGAGVASTLLDVSCRSASYCLAVGLYGPYLQPYAMTWHGSALTPVVRLPVPKSMSQVEATAVSCPAVSSCVVVGTAFDESAWTDPNGSLGFVTMVWTWNGSKWTLHAVPDPANDSLLHYTGVHCLSVASCVLAGFRSPNAAVADTGWNVPVLTRWNGATLTSMKPALATGTKEGQSNAWFGSVSCASAHQCTAVGGAYYGKSEFAFMDVWNGTSWKLAKWAGPKGTSRAQLDGVTCVSASACVAVGARGDATHSVAAALTWNGVKWAVTAVPGPARGKVSAFSGVSCPNARDCVAIGSTGTFGDPGAPLSGLWNGAAWRLRAA